MLKSASWIPRTRAQIGESLQDTPIVNLARLIVQQAIGFPLYLLFHVTGPRHYPWWTNHFNRRLHVTLATTQVTESLW